MGRSANHPRLSLSRVLPALTAALLAGCVGGSPIAFIPDGGPVSEDIGPGERDSGRPGVDAGPAAEDVALPDSGSPVDRDAGPVDRDAGPVDRDAGPVCTPDCAGRECGPDGCQGSCGPCPDGSTCLENGQCRVDCVPVCAGRECGPDGCDGSCGPCPEGSTCRDGQCHEPQVCPEVPDPEPVSQEPLPTLQPAGRTETLRQGGFTDDYLEDADGYIKVGTRREWGSTVIFLGLVSGGAGLNGTNVIDANDTGREVQVALYDPQRMMQGCALDSSCVSNPAASCPGSITYLGWNPVQGGNECNRGSGSEEVLLGDGRLTATVRPLFWNPDWDQAGCGNDGCRVAARNARVSDVRYTQSLRFVSSHIVELGMTVENLGDLDHAPTLQEFPTLYAAYGRVGPNLHVILDSEGRQIPVDQPANDGFFYRDFDSPGPFVALQDDPRSYGVGIYYENRLTAFQAWQKEGVFNNVRARFVFGLPARGTVRARAYLMLGNFETVARLAGWLDSTLPPFGVLDAPAPDESVQGSTLVYGWALDNRGVQRVELLLDGEHLADLPRDQERPDVCRVWPGYPGCDRVGYGGQVDFSRVSPCNHLLEVRATDTEGNSRVIARRRIRVTAG